MSFFLTDSDVSDKKETYQRKIDQAQSTCSLEKQKFEITFRTYYV